MGKHRSFMASSRPQSALDPFAISRQQTIISGRSGGLVSRAVWGDDGNVLFLIEAFVTVDEHIASSTDLHIAHVGLQVSRRVHARPWIQIIAVEIVAYRVHVVAEWRLAMLF